MHVCVHAGVPFWHTISHDWQGAVFLTRPLNSDF